MDNNSRIMKELKELQDAKKNNKGPTVEANMVGNDIRHWKGTIFGPMDTPYTGGTFIVDIEIPSEYPFKPPKMKFDTKIWHPNISSQTGAICLDILKNEWTPALTIRTALISLQALLCAPEPDDPQDAVVANMYKNDINMFNNKAAEWTNNYAKEVTPEDKVKKICEMGFPEDVAREALARYDYDENNAINFLLSM
jgi:ubiquitin-conjugating enzyme (huntingtin interacting protein 2)